MRFFVLCGICVFLACTAHASGFKTHRLVMPAQHWSLTVSNGDQLMHGNPYTPAFENETFSQSLAHTLSGYGFDAAGHSTVVLGHALGGGFYGYVGHASGFDNPPKPHERYAPQRAHTIIGLSWRKDL